MNHWRLLPLLLVNLGCASGGKSAMLPSTHPASPEAPEGVGTPSAGALEADSTTQRTREQLAGSASAPLPAGHEMKDMPGMTGGDDMSGKKWRSSMNPKEIYDHPGKDSMGMELIPVAPPK